MYVYIYICTYIYILCVLLFLHSAADEADFVLLYIHINYIHLKTHLHNFTSIYTLTYIYRNI